ncbi:metallophosphoesterase family protein [Lactiplantibacillus modestisalitolerans]|uniref:Metallophosphoesterase family protein n=1 Tax=Lactiplantibacillus modestisalitolerans TaxID=1457219 RepID=A0ABV5WRB2_9LACO|nr:metallophosphoesterase family protein [Lactiplantibacillus modestisalitolerans]
MERRIAILADIHGNVTALRAVLADAQRVQPTDYWFLGDLFLPGPGTADLYQQLADLQPDVWLQGNWEQGIAAVAQGYGGLSGGSEVYFARLTAYLLTQLSPADFADLIKRPIATSRMVNGLDIGLSHNQPERSTGHDLYPVAPTANFDHLVGKHDVAIYGHTHQQLMRVADQGQLIINPGAVGQPYSPSAKLRADQRAQYALLTINDAGQLAVDFKKVAYDRQAEVDLAARRQLPYLEQYRELRRTGLTVTHDQPLLERINARYGYAAEVQAFFHRRH